MDPVTAGGDIYCMGGSSSFATNACHASVLTATNIYCLGYAPSNWNTFVVEDSVTCNGYQACLNAKVSSSTNTLTISCSQTYSCMDTEVTCPDGYCKISCIPGGTSGVSGCLSGTFDDTEVYYTADTNLIVEPPLCDTRNGGAGDKNCPNLNLITVAERDEMLKNRVNRVLPDEAYVHDEDDEDYTDDEEIDDGEYIDDEFMAFVDGQTGTEKGLDRIFEMLLFMAIGVMIGVVFMIIIERFLSNKGAKYQVLE